MTTSLPPCLSYRILDSIPRSILNANFVELNVIKKTIHSRSLASVARALKLAVLRMVCGVHSSNIHSDSHRNCIVRLVPHVLRTEWMRHYMHLLLRSSLHSNRNLLISVPLHVAMDSTTFNFAENIIPVWYSNRSSNVTITTYNICFAHVMLERVFFKDWLILIMQIHSG